MQILNVKNQLSGNPKQKLKFAKKITTVHGEVDVADPRSTRAMVALMDMNAVLGGAAAHYGGPAAFAEIMSALHAVVFREALLKNQNWFDLFNIVNDAGHCENGLYALKANYGFADLSLQSLKGFRSIESVLTGHGESHLFPQAVQLSNGPLGSAMPQSQGLAMADALAKKNRVTITAISDGACMEGEAREAMAIIPGLAKSGKVAPYVLIISDNNTKLSGRIDQDAYSMEPTFTSLATLGWKLIKIEQGHDLVACYNTIAQAIEDVRANPNVPIALHVKTIKGIGTKKTAESSSGAHGFPLKSAKELTAFVSEIYGGESMPVEFTAWISELEQLEEKINAAKVKSAVPDEKIQAGVSAAMVRAAREGFPVVSISSDLAGSTGVAGFRKEFPQMSYDVGVAESNMVSAAAGMARGGFIPVVDTFAQFGVTKGALPLTMASLSKAPMICVFSHTGFQDAADGASHQALSYYAMVASIPGVEVYALTCSEEADALVYQAIKQFADQTNAGKTPTSKVFFLGRENFAKNYAASAYSLGSPQVVRDNSANFSKSVVLVGVGSLLANAIEAADLLEKSGVGSVVVNPGCLNKIDVGFFAELLKTTAGRIVVAEDHQLIAGYGAVLVHALSMAKISVQVESLGVKNEFGQSAYSAQDLYEKHGLDASAIARSAQALLR